MNSDAVRKTMLFRNLGENEISAALRRLSAEEKSYQKGDCILHSGSVTERMGLVLSGSVNVETNDLWGNRTILSHVGKGEFFAESYAVLEGVTMLVDVTANEDCRVLFLRVSLLRSLLWEGEDWAAKLAANLLSISARKNLALSSRSFHTAPKSARRRIMSYLNAVSTRTHSGEFDIPFDRQQMADYLNLERSALSKELGNMRREGLLSFRKNHFILHTNCANEEGTAQ